MKDQFFNRKEKGSQNIPETENGGGTYFFSKLWAKVADQGTLADGQTFHDLYIIHKASLSKYLRYLK